MSNKKTAGKDAHRGEAHSRVLEKALIAENVHLNSQVARDANEHKLIARLQDTDLARLQSLTRRLMAVQEEERRRLGRELHDRVGSNLSALLLGLELLKAELPPAVLTKVERRLSGLGESLVETLAHVRDVLADLRPTALDELGLVSALRHQAAVLATRHDIKFVVQGDPALPRMTPEREIAFYRIAQEAWTNALKHAQAGAVTTLIAQEGAMVTMQIHDDGVGFEPGARPPGLADLGLTSMRERADAIGADLDLRSAPGQGVQVRLSARAAG